jgi:hypothetical protein
MACRRENRSSTVTIFPWWRIKSGAAAGAESAEPARDRRKVGRIQRVIMRLVILAQKAAIGRHGHTGHQAIAHPASAFLPVLLLPSPASAEGILTRMEKRLGAESGSEEGGRGEKRERPTDDGH